MVFEHDFKKYPELTNTQLQELQFLSPFPQFVDDFYAVVVKVHDGDTIRLRTENRDFDFPLRLLNIDAPELNQEGGQESKEWLQSQIEGQQVQIIIDKFNRVGKYGRLLGRVFYQGQDINDMSMRQGYSVSFAQRNEGNIPDMNKYFMEGAL